MIAVQHLAYEVKKKGEIEDIEQYQLIQIWDKDRSGTVKQTGVKLGRYVDIVIEGSGKDSKPFWIETKSLQSTGFSKHYAPWSYPRKVVTKLSKTSGKSYSSEKGLAHKQFLQDRIAATNNELILDTTDREKAQLSSGFKWWLLDFKPPKRKKKPKAPSELQVKNMRNKMIAMPKGKGKNSVMISLGFKSEKSINKREENLSLIKNKTIELFSIKKWLIDDAKKQLLSGIPDDLIQSIIGESE